MGVSTTQVTLPPEPAAVGRARRAVREALVHASDPDMRDAAELVVSELVTNAVVHAGTEVGLRIIANGAAVRVEIEDGSLHLPVRRTWAQTSGTGRGLLIVEEHVDRWNAARTERGKVVWFEIGELPVSRAIDAAVGAGIPEPVEIVLVDAPLLMHWAWQEHATALLREYLLYSLENDPHALDHHAAASSALSTLREELPAPVLPVEPDALMASSVEPAVSAARVTLRVPRSCLRLFEVLDDVLERAVDAAQQGHLLVPPTQPEIAEMREWLCGEIAGQARGAPATPWRARTDVRVSLGTDTALESVSRELAASAVPLIATNDASVIVAVSAPLVEFLGYAEESELLGRRILVVVPPRFHQAHIAGTTLHATNGRDALLDMWLDVPIVRADGTEVVVGLHVEPRRIDGGLHLFVAHARLPERRQP